MSKNSSAIKHAHLGMPLGTANYRLARMILFELLGRLGENTCHKCGNEIETVEELSVEHKIPWLYGELDLFWNLSNIAFSHRKCNMPDRNHGSGAGFRKVGPAGTAWCSSHQDFLPVGNFNKRSRNWNGLCIHCKDCARQRRSGANAK